MARTLVVPLITGLVVALLGSCASLARNEEWTGHKIDEVIAKKGPPTSIRDTSGGKKLYIWERRHDFPPEFWVDVPTGQPGVWRFSHTLVTRTTFLVAQDGTVVSWTPSDSGQVPPTG